MVRLAVAISLALIVGCGEKDEAAPTVQPGVDEADFTCQDPAWVPGECAEGAVTEQASQGAAHVPQTEPIAYADSPPSSGPHRSTWAKWGEYEYLPPQRWVHNLEHGGIALLYHPCADPTLVDELRDFAQSRPGDATGEFRYVLTPYPGLDTAVAAVAWTKTYRAECVDPANLDLFTANEYRRAPEDVARDGSFDDRWVAR